jgi:phosphotransferase system enzyme I (PtsP)
MVPGMVNKLLKILRKVSEIIAENEQIDAVMAEIVRLLAESLQVAVCSIYVMDEKAEILVLRASHGLNPDCVGKVHLKPGEGITGLSFQQMEIINVGNASTHPRFREVANIGEEAYQAFMSVPLVIGGRCTGVLNLQDSRSGRFPPTVVDMVKSLSSQLANLIVNAKMLAELAAGETVAETPPDDASGQVMLRGVTANPGLGLGRAVTFERFDYFAAVQPAVNLNASQELLLLEHALRQARKETMELEKRAMALISEADASVFNVHLLFLEDRTILDALRASIRDDHHTIEYAIKLANDEFQARFARLSSEIFREKAMDLKDVLLRLLKVVSLLRGVDGADRPDMPNLISQDQVLFSRELLPSDLIRMPLDKIVGIVCEKGGVTAHAAVLAKALNIPALMGVSGVMAEVHEGDEVILDGFAELVYLRPQKEIHRQFNEMLRVGRRLDAPPDSAPAVLRDGGAIAVRANISLVSETSLLASHGASGIGLYRSEFLFMIRDHLPDENTQCRVFRKIVQEARGESVTIRVLDVGADKPLPYLEYPREDNPALGWRGIRMLLDRRDILKTQLKAILRAGAGGCIRVLFPMVTTSAEVLQLRSALDEAETELHAQDVDHASEYKVGIMVEVPSAVFGLCGLLKYVDYVSIGSNDLFQYTFAVDRSNEKVAASFQFLHPVFLTVIAQVAQVVRAVPGKGLAICGEMAGNPMAVPLLIGAGIEDLSMAPKQIPAVKQVIRAFSLAECRALLAESLRAETPETVADLVRNAFSEKDLQA